MAIGWLTILGYALTFLGTAIVFGGVTDWFIRTTIRPACLTEGGDALSILFRYILLFTVLIPLLGLALTTSHLEAPLIFFGELAFFSASFCVIAFKRRRKIATILRNIPNHNYLGIVLIAVSMALRAAPLNGLYVDPSDDPRIYAFLTYLLQLNHGYPFNLGVMSPFSGPISGYNFMVGFPAINYLLATFTNTGLPQSTALLSACYCALVPLGIYVFTLELFKETKLAMLSMFLGMLSAFPWTFFVWGGNADFIAYFLSLGILWITLRSLKSRGWKDAGLLGFVVAGAILIHPYSIVYALPGMLLLPIAIQWRNHPVFSIISLKQLAISQTENFRAALIAACILLPFIVLVIAPQLIHVPSGQFTSAASINEEYSFHAFDIISIWTFMLPFYEQALGWPVLVLVLTLLIIPARRWPIPSSRRRVIPALMVWAVLVPIAFYLSIFSKIPLVAGYVANIRIMYSAIVIPYTILASVSLRWWLSYLRSLGTHRKEILNHEFSVVRLHHRPTSIRNTLFAFVGLFAVIFVCLNASVSYYINSRAATELSPVTEADIRAFGWISAHVPSNSTILVNSGDAGEWILPFTGIKVFPFHMLIGYPPCAVEAEDYVEQSMSNATALKSVEFTNTLQDFEITFVYVGAKFSPIDSTRKFISAFNFLEDPDIYQVIYSSGGAFVFRVNFPAPEPNSTNVFKGCA